ncbi:MAG: GNAT family N-acetyltransferase [Thiotrichaceae bacterium]
MEIHHFMIQERDGMIISCAALYPYMHEKMGEIGCFAVHDKYRGGERGDALLAFVAREAKHLGLEKVFVLTTHTAHWFQERGFVLADLAILPVMRRDLYNYQRQSKVFVKQLDE